MTATTHKLRAIFLAALMIGSVVAIATPVTAEVDSADPEPIDIISADGVTQDPIVNNTNNNRENLPRVESEFSTPPAGDEILVRINVSDDTPVNVTLSTVEDPTADPTTGDFGASGVPGIDVSDGGVNDQSGGAADGIIEVPVQVEAFNGNFNSGENLSVFVRSDGDLNNTNARIEAVTPAIKVVGNGPAIGAPGTDGDDQDNIAPSGSPELRDAYGAEYDDSNFNNDAGPGPDSADPQPDNMDNDPIGGPDEQDGATDSARQLEQVQVVADVEDPQGTQIVDVTANVSSISRVQNVTMHPDINGDGVINPSEEGLTAADAEAAAAAASNPDDGFIKGNGTYIGTFFVEPDAPTGPEDVTVTAENQLDLENTEESQDITIDPKVTGPNANVNVTAQEGDDRVTVVFSDGVFTNEDATGDLTRQDFDYIDQNRLVNSTSIQEVRHEAGSRVAVLVLDDQLGAQDLVTSVFTGEPDNAKSDEIRIVEDEIYDALDTPGAVAVNGGTESDQSIIEVQATGTVATPKPKDGFSGTGPSPGVVTAREDFREVNPEEQVDVNITYDAYDGDPGDGNQEAELVAVSLRATDSAGGTVTKDAIESVLVDDAEGGQRNPRDNTGNDAVIVTGDQDGALNNNVETELDLQRFSAEGASDGRLNVTAQATGAFDATGPAPVGDTDLNNNAQFIAGSVDGAINSSLSVDAVRPAVLTATRGTGASNEISLDLSEFVLDTDGEQLTRADFNYIDNNGAGATEIVEVRQFAPTTDPAEVLLVTDDTITSSDLDEDRVAVANNQIVDAATINRPAEVDGPGDLYKVGNTMRAGLDANDAVGTSGDTEINFTASGVGSLPGVTTSPSPISGEDSIFVRTGSALSLGGSSPVVTFEVTDSAGNTIVKSVQDDGVGDYDQEDQSVLTRIYLTDFAAEKAQPGDLNITAVAGEVDSISGPGGANTPDDLQPFVDADHPVIENVVPANNNEVTVEFSEGVFARGLDAESLQQSDLRYIDGNGIDATRIVDIEHEAGNDTALLRLNDDLSQLDIGDDEIGTVVDQTEDEAGNTVVPGSLSVPINDRQVDTLTVNTDSATGEINVTALQDGEPKAGVDVTFTITSGPGSFDGDVTSITVESSFINNVPSAITTVTGATADTTVEIEAGGQTTTASFGENGENGDNGDSDPQLPIVGGNQNPAADTDDDGQLEDVNGDGELNILDVQTLLDNLDSSAVQDNSDLFNFGGSAGVDIIDVQALLNDA